MSLFLFTDFSSEKYNYLPMLAFHMEMVSPLFVRVRVSFLEFGGQHD